MSGVLSMLNWFRRNPLGLSGRWLAGLALVTLFCGWGGNMLQSIGSAAAVGPSSIAKLALDSLVQTFQLFTLGAPVTAGQSNWLLTVARASGAVVAGTTVLALLAGAFRRDVTAWMVRRMRDHTILCGLGERNKSLALDVAARGAGHAVAVDLDAGKSTSDFCAAHGIRLITGNAREKETLRLANPRRATHAVVATGDDERNLAIVRQLVDLADASPDSPGLAISVAIDDLALADQIATDEAFTRPHTRRAIEITLFSLARLAARDLLARAAFPELALARRQERVRLGMVGISDTQVEILLQFLRLSPIPGLAVPRFDLFVADPEDARARLASRSARLVAMLRDPSDADPPASDWAGEIVLHRLPGRVLSPAADALQDSPTASGEPDITAWVVAGDSQDRTFLAAIQMGESFSRRRWTVPIFAHLPVENSLDAVLKGSGAAPIQPFGRISALCRLEVIQGEREARARALHEFHRSQNAIATAAAKPWGELPETFRQSNRRAIDHLAVKELVARLATGDDRLDRACGIRPELIDELAAMEHGSWRMDRELDGWRHGPARDDVARLHPDLVPFEALSEEVREANRQIVRKLASFQAGMDGVSR